ncbi:TPA: IS21 family transposase [Candidatus Magasanikbacteria bacterium]|nr:IS21 family transposase [Candidatus Magasanikbacteria bacterium]
MRKDVENEIKIIKELDLLNKSELARRFGCNRRTVDRYISGKTSDRKERKIESIIDRYKSTVIEKVDNYGSSSMAVYKFIQKKGYEGGYLTVNNFIKDHKNEEIKKATIRFETTPGLQAQVDWKEKVTMINKNGEKFEINIFLIVLGYSRLKFLKLTSNKSQKTLFECMSASFKYFEGIPKEILFDNMKTVVDRSKTTFRNVVLNTTFKTFSQDAGFEPVTCRAYRAKTKGKVETLAKLVDRLKVYNNEFETFEDLNKIVEEFNNDINNEVSQATNEIPFKRFEEEKSFMNLLPRMDILESYYQSEKEYRVYNDSMINYKGQKYSLETRFIDKYVKVEEFPDKINIYYANDFIVSHEKSNKKLNYKIEHAKEILKSDALKGWEDSEINSFIENTLKNMDIMLS